MVHSLGSLPQAGHLSGPHLSMGVFLGRAGAAHIPFWEAVSWGSDRMLVGKSGQGEKDTCPQ